MASASTSTSVEESDDWDRPFTDEELQAIDTAFLIADSITTSQTASSSSTPVKKRQFSTGVSDDCGTKIRRRLPESLFVFQKQNANSFSLSPCNTNRSNAYDSYRSFSSSSQGDSWFSCSFLYYSLFYNFLSFLFFIAWLSAILCGTRDDYGLEKESEKWMNYLPWKFWLLLQWNCNSNDYDSLVTCNIWRKIVPWICWKKWRDS